MKHPLVHFELLGKDTRDVVKNYANIFDWEINSDNYLQYPVVNTGTSGVSGGFGNVQSDSRTVLYFNTQDHHHILERAEAAGGHVETPITTIDGVRIGRFIDVCGNVSGLFSSEVTIIEDNQSTNNVVGFEMSGDRFLLSAFYRSVFEWDIDAVTGIVKDGDSVPGRMIDGELRTSVVLSIHEHEQFRDACLGVGFHTHGPEDTWIDGNRLQRYKDTLGNVFAVVSTN